MSLTWDENWFTNTAAGVVEAKERWQPPEPPSLAGIDEIELDFETNGLRWWKGALPVGAGVALPDGRTFYLPWAHRGGGNLDEAVVARWFREQVKFKKITNLNTRFDAHMGREWGRKWGVDLEEQGNRLSDVGHQAGLLDDHRQRHSLASLVEDFLPGEAKVTVVNGVSLDPTRMADYHAGIVAVRAEADVRQVQKLKNLFRPRLEAEDLLRVLDLEDRLIWVTVEMEKNGTRIDVPRLHRWLKKLRKEIESGLREIGKIVGRQSQASLFEGAKKDKQSFNPDSPRDMEMLFTSLGLPISRTAKGQASFAAAIMRSIDHPVIRKVFRLGKLVDVESKLLQYAASVDESTGILRYALHQMRAQKDPWDEHKSAGTISGRYSSTKIAEDPDEGINIQAVWKAAQQRKAFGIEEDDDSHDDDIFIQRQLHIPADGRYHLTADAMQIEYRLFADDTGSERLLKMYEENPLASYHKGIHAQIKPFKPDLSYRRCKDLNFAKQYGAGIRKMAWMLGFISEEQFRALNEMEGLTWLNDPLLAETREINRIYDLAVPEVKPLLAKAEHYARPSCGNKCRYPDGRWKRGQGELHAALGDHRGFIRTLLGRRTRFPNGHRVHKALNGRIQGGGADIMKMKLVELHEARFDTGFLLRWPLHDEVDGDVDDRESAMKVNRILNRQSVETNVPILWEVGMGPNWKENDDMPVAFRGKLWKETENGLVVTEDV